MWTEGLPLAGEASWSLCTPSRGSPHAPSPLPSPGGACLRPGFCPGLGMGPGLRSLSRSPGDSHHWGSGKLVVWVLTGVFVAE